MKPAHTIVDVPLHVERVPTYVRRALREAGPRVKIGCAYNPAYRIEPAFYRGVKAKPRVRVKRIVFVMACIAVAFLAGIGMVPA